LHTKASVARICDTVDVLILNRAQTESLLELDELRQAVATAMIDLSEGGASMPPRIAARVDPLEAMLVAMPAHLPGLDGLAAKLVSLFPSNAAMGRPTHQAVVVVFDAHTGEPEALIDGTSITAARTAAGSALSVDLLARPEANRLTILGTGVQARAHAHAVVRVRNFNRILIAGRDRERARTLARELHESMGVEAVAADGYAEACAEADVVCATTHSPDPVVQRHHLRPGVHVTSVGYNVQGREVDSQTIADCVLVVESRESVLAAPPSGSNDILVPIEQGLIGPDHIHAEIGEILAGTRPGRSFADEITLYKSVGVAVQDVAAAALVVRRALAEGVGVEVDF
jgi:alanine dehydrogenase